MSDEDKLKGEQVETPSSSPEETITPEQGESVNPQGAGNLSPEEESWNNLTGSSQERFRQTIREKNELRDKLSQLEAQVQNLSANAYNPYKVEQNPEVDAAVRKLSDYGIATKDEVEKTVNQKLGGIVYKMEIDRLTGKYNGSNGLPAFDADEYEDFVSSHPQYKNYNPEDVYEKMFEDEIFAYKLQQHGKGATNTQPSTSLRPTKTQVKEEPMTLDYIEARLKEPDGRQWYEKNRDTINTVVTKASTSE